MRNSYNADACYIFIISDTANYYSLLHARFLLNNCTFIMIKTGSYYETYLIMLCILYCTRMKNRCPQVCQFKHLVIGDLIQFTCIFHDARVG
ncbi:hypothetical protein D3C81_1220200 [compost metagenome]